MGKIQWILKKNSILLNKLNEFSEKLTEFSEKLKEFSQKLKVLPSGLGFYCRKTSKKSLKKYSDATYRLLSHPSKMYTCHYTCFTTIIHCKYSIKSHNSHKKSPSVVWLLRQYIVRKNNDIRPERVRGMWSRCYKFLLGVKLFQVCVTICQMTVSTFVYKVPLHYVTKRTGCSGLSVKHLRSHLCSITSVWMYFLILILELPIFPGTFCFLAHCVWYTRW